MLRLTELRETRHETKAEVGARAKVHPAHVGAIENGRLVPREDSVILGRLARALGWKGEPRDLLEKVD